MYRAEPPSAHPQGRPQRSPALGPFLLLDLNSLHRIGRRPDAVGLSHHVHAEGATPPLKKPQALAHCGLRVRKLIGFETSPAPVANRISDQPSLSARQVTQGTAGIRREQPSG